jgi:hypothetical protein
MSEGALAHSAAVSPPSNNLYHKAKHGRLPLPELIIGCGIAWMVIDDWLAPVALFLLWAIWRLLPATEGPPTLAMALSFQWTQAAIGVFYHGLTGRPMEAIEKSDYRPMVLMSLGAVASILLGLIAGRRWGTRPLGPRPERTFSDRGLFVLYAVFLVGLGTLETFAWALSAITQGILALGFLRFVVLYLLFRRLTMPVVRWGPLVPLVLFEVGLGFTGYFASFREPLILLVLALIERFDRTKARHWVTLGGASAAVLATALLWLSIRTSYRHEFELEAFAESRSARFERIVSLSRGWLATGTQQLWENLDFLVDRLWAIYYPALAVSRVPNVLPHEDGRILWGAVHHILTPRIFFPEKGILPSDSEMVRKYSGLWVAGTDEGTSIAFGYVAESYVDFGLPWMFIPMAVYGALMGWAYQKLLQKIWYRELAVGLVTVVFWLSLYLFERSWIKTIGNALTLILYMGLAVFILDRLLRLYHARWLRRRGITPTEDALVRIPLSEDPPALAPIGGPAGA